MSISQISPAGGGVDTQLIDSDFVTQVMGANTLGPVKEEDLRNRFLSFEPIFDHRGEVMARELVLRGTSQPGVLPGELARMNEDMLLTGLYSLSQDGLTGDQPLFVQISRDVLFSDVLQELTQSNLVWVLRRPGKESRARACALAHSHGLRFCLDDDPSDPGETGWAYQRFSSSPSTRLSSNRQTIVRNIQQAAQIAQWDEKVWFMGEWFTGPRLDGANESGQELRMELVTVAMRQPLTSLVQFVRLNPALESQLLRIAGCSAGGLSRPADSATHALILLGRQRAQRVCILTALCSSPASADNRLFAKIALSRAMLMGKLALSTADARLAPLAFETGLLSTLPAAMSISVSSLQRRLGLDPAVAQALAGHDTVLRKLLQLAYAGERNDTALLVKLSGELGLPLETVSAAHLESLVTAEDMDSRLI